jgi:hypothetical protein
MPISCTGPFLIYVLLDRGKEKCAEKEEVSDRIIK